VILVTLHDAFTGRENRPNRRVASLSAGSRQARETENNVSYFSINRVVLVGRLTREPELRSTPAGTSVCSLRVACNGARRDPQGDFVEKPNFFDVSVFGPAAESVSNYMRRGSRVGVDGRLEWREWETAEKHKRQAVSIVADTVQFLDGARGERADDSPGEGGRGELTGVGVSDEEIAF
jgi:single-strand DNA-binding protein